MGLLVQNFQKIYISAKSLSKISYSWYCCPTDPHKDGYQNLPLCTELFKKGRVNIEPTKLSLKYHADFFSQFLCLKYMSEIFGF